MTIEWVHAKIAVLKNWRSYTFCGQWEEVGWLFDEMAQDGPVTIDMNDLGKYIVTMANRPLFAPNSWGDTLEEAGCREWLMWKTKGE